MSPRGTSGLPPNGDFPASAPFRVVQSSLEPPGRASTLLLDPSSPVTYPSHHDIASSDRSQRASASTTRKAISYQSLMVCAHIDTAIPNFLIQELNVLLDHPVAREILRGIPEVQDGYFEIPVKPGLGMELDEEAARWHPGKPYDRPIITGADGAIGLE